MEKTIKKNNQILNIPKIGDVVEGIIIDKGRASVFLDLGAIGTGIIYGKEFYNAKEKLKDTKKGEIVLAKVVDLDNEDGYIELSLSGATKELAWHDLSEKKESNENLKVKILGANKGGLLTEISGLPAFLPVSQLSANHYPKVDGGDTQKIFRELQKFIGKELEVRVLDFNPQEDKLILSEKAKETKKIEEALKNFKEGDIVEVEVTGIADFGIFVKFKNDKINDDKKEDKKDREKETEDEAEYLDGLIHISELSWQLVENPAEIVEVGEKIKAKIINISDNKVSLSLKALEKDPWQDIEKKYKKGDIIKGKIVKLNPFGAFVQITPDIQGLCHISEFSSYKKMEETLEIGKKYEFQISLIEPEKYRINLKFVDKKKGE